MLIKSLNKFFFYHEVAQSTTRSHTKKKFIVKIIDFNDEFTKRHLKTLEDKFNTKKIGEVRSIFNEIQTCTLHTYHSPTFHYYLVKSG